MSTLAILQARMTSTRLPGKVLMPILGQPMIARQIERLRRAQGFDRLVVATTTDASDDALVAVVEGLGVPVIRGEMDDVLVRFVRALDAFDPDTVVRLTADCPLASPRVIDRVIAEFNSRGLDYLSNTLQPTYPDGLDVEVVRAEVLRKVAAASTDPHEREHVTLGVYRHPELFTVGNVAGDVDLSDLRWTVDNAEDLDFVRSVYTRLYPGDPEFDIDAILELLRAEPSLSRTSLDAVRNAALEGLETGAMET